MAKKLSNISGFPEWLPHEKILEEKIVRQIRNIYEGYGFVPIETPAVELLNTLTAKGVVEKELYTVQRLNAEAGEKTDIGLHFDLTVPFARYVAQHANDLVFPFKRYQIQKVWRGERPQKGRFREFTQFDIDLVARDTLPISCDAEALCAFNEALSSLELGEYVIKLNNRKILSGFFSSLDLSEDQVRSAIKAIDKVDKIGKEGVQKELEKEQISTQQAEKILSLCDVKFSLSNINEELEKLGVTHPEFIAGKEELYEISKLLSEDALEKVEVQLSLARGLDYYTGIIAEVHLVKYPEFGSIGGGGRYEGLVSDFSSLNIPGVGFSIGLTRLMDLILTHSLKETSKKSFAKVLIAVYNEEQRSLCNTYAAQLRGKGIATEVFFKSPKLGKQIDFAAKKGIEYVLFISEDGSLELKNITTGNQEAIESIDELVKHISV